MSTGLGLNLWLPASLGSRPSKQQQAAPMPLGAAFTALAPAVDRLSLLNPRSPTFIEDAIGFQLCRGPHHFVPGTIPHGTQLALMAWGLIRAFELCEEWDYDYDCDYDWDSYDDVSDYSDYAAYATSCYGDDATKLNHNNNKPYHDCLLDHCHTPTLGSPGSESDSDMMYTSHIVHFPRLDVAEHPWPILFGKGEPPVRSRWLLSFEETAHLLQRKAYLIAATMGTHM